MEESKPPEPKEEPKLGQVVNTQKGEATRYSLPTTKRPKREPEWTVRWKAAQVEYTDDSKFGGTMEGVTGTIYENGMPVSDFSADHGAADKETGLLTLYDNVKVWAREGLWEGKRLERPIKAVMRCDKMEWLAERKLVRAIGNVSFEIDAYEAGTFKELVATPELDSFGTPDQFPAMKKDQ